MSESIYREFRKRVQEDRVAALRDAEGTEFRSPEGQARWVAFQRYVVTTIRRTLRGDDRRRQLDVLEGQFMLDHPNWRYEQDVRDFFENERDRQENLRRLGQKKKKNHDPPWVWLFLGVLVLVAILFGAPSWNHAWQLCKDYWGW